MLTKIIPAMVMPRKTSKERSRCDVAVCDFCDIEEELFTEFSDLKSSQTYSICFKWQKVFCINITKKERKTGIIPFYAPFFILNNV